MPERERRYPSIEEVIEKAKRGIIDDTSAVVPPFDREDWEILGDPPPEEPVNKHPETPARRRHVEAGRRPGSAPN